MVEDAEPAVIEGFWVGLMIDRTIYEDLEIVGHEELKLALSKRTIKSYMSHLFTKLALAGKYKKVWFLNWLGLISISRQFLSVEIVQLNSLNS